MLMYWVLFAFFAVGSAVHLRPETGSRAGYLFACGLILIMVVVGFRYQVGADWDTYQRILTLAGNGSLTRAISRGDPAYQAICWLVDSLGGKLWVVNLICAAIYVWGLSRFARLQRDPWLAVLVSIPYLTVVVAMGYTRQATALGVLMAGFAALLRGGSFARFSAYVVVAALFHRTAVAVFPLALFSVQRNRLLNLVVGVTTGLLLYQYFLADALDKLVRNYLDSGYSSQGAAIRLSMSFVPAVLFVIFRKRLQFTPREDRLWWIFSLMSFLMLVLLFVLPSSTAVDRLAIYLIPLQLAFFTQCVVLFRRQSTGTLLVIAYAATVLFVWLNFAVHARYWLPYQFYPL